MIKASSMQTLPKGKTPPISIVVIEPMCHVPPGTTRAILLVSVGTSITSAFKPKNDPTMTKGAETQTHSINSNNTVKKFTAVAAPAICKKMFKQQNIKTKTPGNAVAVKMAFIFQALPWQNL